jgi:glycosyltransferase involved in cell wall biosynthesis
MGTAPFNFNLKEKYLRGEHRIQRRLFKPHHDSIEKRNFRGELSDICKTALLALSPFAVGGVFDYFNHQPGFTYDMVHYIISTAEYLLQPDPQSHVPRILDEYWSLFAQGVVGAFVGWALGSWTLSSFTSDKLSLELSIMEEIFDVAHYSEKTEIGMYYKRTGKGKESWEKAKKKYFKDLSESADIENIGLLLAKDNNLEVHTRYLKALRPDAFVHRNPKEIAECLNRRNDREKMQVPRGRRTRVSFAMPKMPHKPQEFFQGYVYNNPYNEDETPEESLGLEILVKKLSNEKWVFGSIGPKKPWPSFDPRSIAYKKLIKSEALAKIGNPSPLPDDWQVAAILEGTYPLAKGGVSAFCRDVINGINPEHCGGKRPYFKIVHLNGYGGPSKTQVRYPIPSNAELHVITLFGHTKNPCLNTFKKIEGDLFAKRRPKEKTEDYRTRELKRLIENLESAFDTGDIPLFYSVTDRMQYFSSQELLRSQAALEALHDIHMRIPDKDKVPFRLFQYYWRDLRQQLVAVAKSEKVKAKVYYPFLTGTAGVYAALAKREFAKNNESLYIFQQEHGNYKEDREVDFVNSPYPPFIIKHWQKVFSMYSRISYLAADKITTLCQINVEKARIHGVPEDKEIEIIPVGVRLEEKVSTADCSGLDNPEVCTIANPGNIQPVKRVGLFIEAIKLLQRKYSDYIKLNAYVLGRYDPDVQEYGDRIQTSVKESPELRDIFHITEYSDFRDAFPPIDILGLTSSSEVQPLVILEAMLLGKPFVGFDIGAIAEMINGTGPNQDNYGPCGIVLGVGTWDEEVKSVADAFLTLYLRKYYKLTNTYHPDIKAPDQALLDKLIACDFEKIGPTRVREKYGMDLALGRIATNIYGVVAK